MKIICKICNMLISKRNFKKHLVTHNILEKDYYDIYLRKLNEGICPTCGKETTFHGLWSGYSIHCNTSCSAADPQVLKKKNNTMINTYGFVSHFSDPITQQHIKESYINNFGVDNPAKSLKIKNKMKETCLKKYGTASPFASKEVQEKIKQTNLMRYNVANPFESAELMKNAYSYEARLKAYKTKQKNNNGSSLENYLENIFITNNILYKSQYNLDPRYPFHCDFYLPNTDTFIEINGFWTHGSHWFDANNLDDINVLNFWKEKLKYHSMYEAAIRQWTKTDPLKRNIAKTNNLNYVVLWTLEDIQMWIESNFEIRHDY